jgi:hypothetical protein
MLPRPVDHRRQPGPVRPESRRRRRRVSPTHPTPVGTGTRWRFGATIAAKIGIGVSAHTRVVYKDLCASAAENVSVDRLGHLEILPRPSARHDRLGHGPSATAGRSIVGQCGHRLQQDYVSPLRRMDGRRPGCNAVTSVSLDQMPRRWPPPWTDSCTTPPVRLSGHSVRLSRPPSAREAPLSRPPGKSDGRHWEALVVITGRIPDLPAGEISIALDSMTRQRVS